MALNNSHFGRIRPRVAAFSRRVAAGLAAVTSACLVLSALPAASGEIVEQILVKVNGEIFTKTQLEKRQVEALRGLGRQLSDQELQKQLTAVTPDILVSVVDEMLLLQRGRDLGYRLTDDMFRQAVENIRKENKLEDDAKFKAALAQEGMTMADLRENIETQSIIQELQRSQIFSRISVTETEEREYYEARRGEFTTPATLTIREILVQVSSDAKGVNVAADEAAREEAAKIRADIESGRTTFEKAVAEFSDAASKANGGLVGPLNLGELAPDLAKLLKPLQVGDLTEVVRTPGGYQILKVETRTEPTVATFEQARGEIANRILNDRRRVEFEKFMARLRASAIIEWKNAELQKLYEERLKTLAVTGS